jgi:exopolysaccharide biosynthesis protein
MQKNRPKLGKSFVRMMAFLTFQVIVGGIMFPLFVFYGPFQNIRDTLVGTAMTTYSHQYIAKFFLSDHAIDQIMGSNFMGTIEQFDFEPQEDLLKINSDIVSDKIQVFHIDGGNFQGKLIKIDDPKRIEVGFTQYMPRAGETTSAIARRNNAIAAINAGGFFDDGFTGTGGSPSGFIIHQGEVVHNQSKRDDILQDTIAFTYEGRMIVGRYTIKRLLELNVKEGVSFGPFLIVNGKPSITSGDGGWGIAPRTAIAQTKDGAILFLVIDGRSTRSIGARLVDIQDIFLQHGAITAANLDGGSSTTMYYNGKVINRPSDSLGERTVPTVFMAMPESSIF